VSLRSTTGYSLASRSLAPEATAKDENGDLQPKWREMTIENLRGSYPPA